MPRASLTTPKYTPTKGDLEIFKLAATHPNAFLDFYLKSETSGTWWLPGAKTDKWRNAYDSLHESWVNSKKSERFSHKEKTYQAFMDHEKSLIFPNSPAFFYNHGTRMLEWAVEYATDRTPIRTILGGFGAGKTMNIALSMLVEAATLVGYRAFVLAPSSTQCREVYKQLIDAIDGTPYAEKFLISHAEHPNPIIRIGHKGIGSTTIEFYPIENNVRKLRTLTGDRAIIDQSEQLFNIGEIIRTVSTRFRGRVPKNGRSRIGTITFIANAEENDELWDIYDRAEKEPDSYKSRTVSSLENSYLTDEDLFRFYLAVGKTQEDVDQYISGKRPQGDGKVFSRDVINRMKSKSLDDYIENNSALISRKDAEFGLQKLFLPYQEGRNYLVVSDPGTLNPPNRDSPVILVFDFTDFPTEPAKIVGFHWIDGNNSIDNWATAYSEAVSYYKAQASNAFDATGYQSGYDTWLALVGSVYPEKVSLSGNNKYLAINSSRFITSKNLVIAPSSLHVLYNQMSKYDYPEPDHLRQDIVITFIVACQWLQRLYYMTYVDSSAEVNNIIQLAGRYKGRHSHVGGRRR